MTNPAEEGGRDPKTIQSVLRAIEVLEVVAQSGSSCSISQISAETGIPGPTVFRLLSTMLSRGWVIKTKKREYSIGAAFFGLTAVAGASIGSTMDEVLDTLVRRTGESASVAMLDHNSAFYVAHRTSNHAMRLFTQVGNRVPLYATAVGKSLMAAMPDRDLNAYLKEAILVNLTDHTITDFEALKAEIAVTRERGYAIDDEEQEIGVRCAATWIRGVNNFAVSVSGPPSRMNKKFIEEIARPAMVEAAQALHVILSGPGRSGSRSRDIEVPPVYMGLGI